MKNIQVIDGAVNCVYDIFAASDADFREIFNRGEDIAFIDEVIRRHRGRKKQLQTTLARIWKRRVTKRKARGIHGTLLYELPDKKAYYTTRRDAEAKNPDGTSLRDE
jgi:hypothetical protein